MIKGQFDQAGAAGRHLYRQICPDVCARESISASSLEHYPPAQTLNEMTPMPHWLCATKIKILIQLHTQPMFI
ncbi:hypothetical protein CUMW_126800, partial [Citrus unshiu]